MSLDIDILNVDAEILRNFQVRHDRIAEMKRKLADLEKCKTSDLHGRVALNVQQGYENLIKKISILESNEDYNFYVAETAEILQEYKRLLSIPIKQNFLGKQIRGDKDKQRIIDSYIAIAKNYIDIVLPVNSSEKTKKSALTSKTKIYCDNCNNRKEKDFDILDGDTYICLLCFSEQIILKHASSYKDSDRININTKYTYDRRVHFRDSVQQYMGKQNSTVEPKVYEELEREFANHYLLIGDADTDKKTRFQKITKEHIMIFLKDLGHTKHYENVNLIHHTLTGKKPDDISHLEDKLMLDFDELTELYDKLYKNIDRKNFINTQYVLFCLLVRHKHPCKKEDFAILKTIDRKNFHDEVSKHLFLSLGWNWSPPS